MISRAHRFGTLVFDRDAIVRAALRAYVEAILSELDPQKRLRFRPCVEPDWRGDLHCGAFDNRDGCGNHEVVAWTEAGVVALGYELGFGPIEERGLSVDAVTGGPDDVRGVVPGLPSDLEPALVHATSMLDEGPEYGEKQAGVGFWLHGDRVAGTFFDDPNAAGLRGLAAWGMLQNGRLPLMGPPATRAVAAELDRTRAAPIHGIVDAVVARALIGPTELTADEMATLLPTPPDAALVLAAQRSLQKVGVTWPGSPQIPPEPPRTGINPFLRQT